VPDVSKFDSSPPLPMGNYRQQSKLAFWSSLRANRPPQPSQELGVSFTCMVGSNCVKRRADEGQVA